MSTVYDDLEPSFGLRLDDNKVIVKEGGVYDGSVEMSYTQNTTFTFENSEKATEYFYLKKAEFLRLKKEGKAHEFEV